MSTIDSPRWTAERQLRFLDQLLETRNVRTAAAFAGMSRESAYRLRTRRDGALFALLWDRVLQPSSSANHQGHIEGLSDGRLARLLGNHFRRESGEFLRIGQRHGAPAPPNRT